MQTKMDQVIRPIGVVHSDVRESRDMPLQGAPAVIEIYAEFLEGLRGIEENTHINVIGWFDKAARTPLVITPRKIRRTNPTLGKHGVFSLRSPVRPNPLSLSVTHLLKVERSLLYVEPLDLVDASPIIDIKPYSAGWDVVFWARDRHSRLVARGAIREDALAALTRDAYNFHGERCFATAGAARVIYDAAIELEADPRDLVIELPANVNPHVADSLIGVTRATLGNGRLSLCSDQRQIIVSLKKRSVSYRLLHIEDWSTTRILGSPSASLFERKP